MTLSELMKAYLKADNKVKTLAMATRAEWLTWEEAKALRDDLHREIMKRKAGNE
jgi:hypothetical protein